MEVMSLLTFLETGKPAMDLRPTNGATAPECTDLARLTVVTAEEDIIEEAIFLLTFLVHKSETLLLELKSFCSNFLFIMF
jgi:hypothetical protein